METLSAILQWSANGILVYVTGSFLKFAYEKYQESKNNEKNK